MRLQALQLQQQQLTANVTQVVAKLQNQLVARILARTDERKPLASRYLSEAAGRAGGGGGRHRLPRATTMDKLSDARPTTATRERDAWRSGDRVASDRAAV